MHQYKDYLKVSRESMSVADHMIKVTYEYVNDPKLLFTIVKKAQNAVYYAILALLDYNLTYKKILPFSKDKEAVFSLFIRYSNVRYKFKEEYVPLIMDLNSIVKEYNKSSVTLRRNDKFFIYDEEYHSKVLKKEGVNRNIEKAKRFIQEVEGILKVS